MDRRLVFGLILVLLILSTFLSGCAGTSRIGGFFQNGDYLKHSKIIDFFIFFTLFFSLTYLGFTKWFGGEFGKGGTGKGAIVGLSIALSLALTFAIISQTAFSITSLFPLAKSILFLAVALLLYGLLNNLLKVEGKMSKVLLFLFSLILVYILFSIFTYFVCMTEGNYSDPACRGGAFTWLGKMGERYIWGSWFRSGWFAGGGSGIRGGTSGGGTGIIVGTTDTGGGVAAGFTEGVTGQPSTSTQAYIDDLMGNFTTDDGSVSYGKIGLGLLLLLLFGGIFYFWWRKRGARKTLERINIDVKNLKNQLTQLWQRRAEIIRDAARRMTSTAQKQKLSDDYDALLKILRDITYEDSGQRLPMRYANLFVAAHHPELNVIDDFFNNPSNFDGLEQNERDSLWEIVKQEKIIEWKLMRTFDWYRMFFKRKLHQVSEYEKNLATTSDISPILHSNRKMSVIFKPSLYKNIDMDYKPQVVFIGKAPGGMRAETRDIFSLPPGQSAHGNQMNARGDVFVIDFEVPVPLTDTRYKYVFEYRTKDGLLHREYDPQNNLFEPDTKFSVLIA